MSLPDDKIWWCWLMSWGASRVVAERKRFSGNTFYYARNKAACRFKVDPQQIDGVQVKPVLGPPTGRSVKHSSWPGIPKKEDSDEPKGTKDAGVKRAKRKKARAGKKRRGKAARRDS